METNEKKWCVYIHRNMINNKAYIGITSRNPEERWGNNGSQYHKGCEIAFKSAIQKYGWDNFEHIIWAEKLTEKEAKMWEIRLIALFKTNCTKYKNPSYGYNLTDGGEGTIGYKHTDEAKRKMSDAKRGKEPWNKGVPSSDETKQKLRESRLGHIEPDEQKEKIKNSLLRWWSNEDNRRWMSEIRKGQTRSEEAKKSMREKNQYKRKVVQLTLDGEFVAIYDGIRIAGEITGIQYKNISACIRHIRKQAGGYIWLYEWEYDTSIQYKYIRDGKTIVQLSKDGEFIREYKRMKDVAKEFGCSEALITRCCLGQQKYLRGYILMYKSEYEQLTKQND